MALDGLACIFWALALLVLPLNWLLAAAVAALFHEGCHYAALRLLGGRAGGLRIGITGAVMDISGLTPGRELVCALAGPVGALLLLPLCPLFPRLALCALVQSAFNLLPVWPLDGGRAVRCLLTLFLPERGVNVVCTGMEITACGLLFAGSFLLKLGIAPCILALGVILRALSRKIPCKAANLRVQ